LARRGDLSAEELLGHVVEEEYKCKQERARESRLKRARIPEPLVMETFPFERQPKLDRKRILALYDAFDYMAKGQNLIWIGPAGCGKTGLSTSFLIQAIHRGYTGRYVEFPELVEELEQSARKHSEEKVIKRYLAYDCLLIDDVGSVEVEPDPVGLFFFTLIAGRHGRKPTLITSNLAFAKWPSFLKDDNQLAALLIQRLTEGCHVINMMRCISVRPKVTAQGWALRRLAERSSARERRQAMNEMMDGSLPTAIELAEDPELAVLRCLKTNLKITELALAAAYPEICEHTSVAHSPSEPEAYASAIVYQIDALDALLDHYVESIGRLRQRWHREPDDKEVPF
jgi:DNA replication protein DnaC